MRLSHKDDYEGWTIETECREDNPEGWKPGDPIRYVAWGAAVFRHPHVNSDIWSSTAKQSIPQAHFADFNKAHSEIRTALVAKIDILKKVA